MKNIHKIAFHPGSREELLPDFAKDFPYIASRAEMDRYIGRSAPWHWHKAVEKRSLSHSLPKTPAEYIKSYRLQKACQMLAGTSEPLTVVSQACGLGSSSYFGKVFREHAHCTPSEYRQKWQDFDR